MAAPCSDGRCDGSGFLYDDETRRSFPCSCRPQRQARRRAAAVAGRIPKAFREVSFEREVFPALLAEGVKVCGYVDASYWRDMGTPEDFVRGSADLVRGIAPSPALGGHRGEHLVHDGAAVSPGALLIGGTVVGRGAEIGPGARLDGAVIFDGVLIEAGSVIERSIVGFGARIGPRALIRDGVIGDGANVGARCELLRSYGIEHAVVITDGPWTLDGIAALSQAA